MNEMPRFCSLSKSPLLVGSILALHNKQCGRPKNTPATWGLSISAVKRVVTWGCFLTGFPTRPDGLPGTLSLHLSPARITAVGGFKVCDPWNRCWADQTGRTFVGLTRISFHPPEVGYGLIYSTLD